MKFIRKIIPFVLSITLSITSFAIGDGNIDGGGGDMGGGTGANKWIVGDDGVRITVVSAKSQNPVKSSVDFTNKNPAQDIYHFGKVSKISYKNGRSLKIIFDKPYIYETPSTEEIPPIISPSGASNIAEIKRHFTSEGFLKDLCIATDMEYEALISGEYKLLLEPIAYFTYNGVRYAATAHEASMLDQLKDGDLSNKIGQLTRKNLPLSMFLETSDLGFPKWTGTTSGIVSNRDIQTSLGVGVVKFKEGGEILPPQQQTDVEYRINTEVITSFLVTATSSTHPDNPASVTMTTSTGKSHTFNVELKKGTSQLVWMKWTTPSAPCNVSITATANGTLSLTSNTVNAKISDISCFIPPNPEGRDTNKGFRIPTYKDKIKSCTSLSWRTFSAWLDTQIIHSQSLPTDDEWFTIKKYYRTETYTDSEGKTHTRKVFDRQKIGCWKYDAKDWSASLAVLSAKIYPDEKVPTAIKKAFTFEMKSGYGFDADINTKVLGNGDRTAAQSVVALFPEFNYDSYCRLLVTEDRTQFAKMFHFAKNPYSRFSQPVHFTPLWFPDKDYKVYFLIFDAWTPAGQLSQTANSYIQIEGDVYDDWHIGLFEER